MNVDMALLFDMDGVLLDSNKIAADSFNAVLQPYGITMADVKDEFGEGYKGGSLRDFLLAVEAQYGYNLDLQDFSRQAGDWAFAEMDRVGIKADDNLVELLKDLKAQGIRLAVGTSSMRWRALKILDTLGITSYFNAIVTADEVTEHKPHPHIYLEAARQLGITPEHCIVIEDAASGVEAAQRAHMRVVGFTKYGVPEGALQKADMIIGDWTELTLRTLATFIAPQAKV